MVSPPGPPDSLGLISLPKHTHFLSKKRKHQARTTRNPSFSWSLSLSLHLRSCCQTVCPRNPGTPGGHRSGRKAWHARIHSDIGGTCWHPDASLHSHKGHAWPCLVSQHAQGPRSPPLAHPGWPSKEDREHPASFLPVGAAWSLEEQDSLSAQFGRRELGSHFLSKHSRAPSRDSASLGPGPPASSSACSPKPLKFRANILSQGTSPHISHRFVRVCQTAKDGDPSASPSQVPGLQGQAPTWKPSPGKEDRVVALHPAREGSRLRPDPEPAWPLQPSPLSCLP